MLQLKKIDFSLGGATDIWQTRVTAVPGDFPQGERKQVPYQVTAT
jgi:hypothetical protein